MGNSKKNQSVEANTKYRLEKDEPSQYKNQNIKQVSRQQPALFALMKVPIIKLAVECENDLT